MDPINYTIERAAVDDRERISHFLRKHFYKHEPIHSSLDLPTGHTCVGEILPLTFLHQDLSLIAVSKRDGLATIVGVCLNRETTPEDVFPNAGVETCDKYKLQHYIIKNYVNNSGAVLWKHSGASRSLQVQHIGVEDSLRRTGIAKALVEASSKMAAAEGFTMMHIECSSAHAARMVEKLGWECVYVLRYDEMVDDNGVQRVFPRKPHEAVKTFVRVL